MGSKHKGLRLAAILAIVVVGAGLITARIWWINQTQPTIPVVTSSTGEWVSLDGVFQEDINMEQSSEYSIMVEGATIRTYDEYLRAHGVEPKEPGRYGTAHCVVDMTVRIKREGGEKDGYISLFQSVLIPARSNEYLMVDAMNENALWPQVLPTASSQPSMKPNTEMVLHIPYIFNGGEEQYEREITDRHFTWLLSRMPERRVIEFDADIA